MKKIVVAVSLLMLAAAFLLSPVVVLAQTTVPANDTTVNVGSLFAPWMEMLMGTLSLLFTVLVGWIAAMIKQRTGIVIQNSHRDALQQALTNGAGLVLQKLGGKLDTMNLEIKNEALRAGVDYVIKNSPDALEYFGITPQTIAEKLRAKLGVITALTTEPV